MATGKSSVTSQGSPPQISDLQKRTIEAIVNVFETGTPFGDYGAVTLLAGDSGHLTYGRSQTTLASGNLYLLLREYANAPNGRHSSQITPYLDRLRACDLTLDFDYPFRGLLSECGQDPIMEETQNTFFDNTYWVPALRAGAQANLTLPLSFAVAYDSHIQGGWTTIAEKTKSIAGTIGSAGVTEQAWMIAYINNRKAWLTARSTLLAKTTYRMDAFTSLIVNSKWRLDLPITVVGKVIDETVLLGRQPIRVSADDTTQRLLYVASPFLSGPDVVRVQQALQQKGLTCNPDGVYTNSTAMLIRTFQQENGLAPDGIVGPATRTLLLGS
jgi:chitosanase